MSWTNALLKTVVARCLESLAISNVLFVMRNVQVGGIHSVNHLREIVWCGLQPWREFISKHASDHENLKRKVLFWHDEPGLLIFLTDRGMWARYFCKIFLVCLILRNDVPKVWCDTYEIYECRSCGDCQVPVATLLESLQREVRVNFTVWMFEWMFWCSNWRLQDERVSKIEKLILLRSKGTIVMSNLRCDITCLWPQRPVPFKAVNNKAAISVHAIIGAESQLKNLNCTLM